MQSGSCRSSASRAANRCAQEAHSRLTDYDPIIVGVDLIYSCLQVSHYLITRFSQPGVGEVRLLVGHCRRVLFLFLSSYLSCSFSYLPLLGKHIYVAFAI